MPIIHLSSQQAISGRDALVLVYDDVNAFKEALAKIGQVYSRLETSNMMYQENVLKILKLAGARGWLLQLVAQALLDAPGDPAILSIQQDLQARAPGAADDPFLAVRLSGSNFMADRIVLRDHLRDLTMPYGKRLLVVKGNRRSGKSHTLQFLSFLNQCLGSFVLRRLDLEDFARMSGIAVKSATTTSPIQITTAGPHGFTSGSRVYIDGICGLAGANGLWNITVSGPVNFVLADSRGTGLYASGGTAKLRTPIEASQLADFLVDLLPFPYTPPEAPRDAQWARWVVKFANNLETVALAANIQTQHWIVIDSFHAVLLAQSSIDLIRELARRINLTLPNMRLVLLGFEDSLTSDVVNHLAEETIGPITEDELILFIESGLKQSQLPHDEAKVTDVYIAVTQDANPADPDFLLKLEPVTLREFVKAGAAR